MAVTYDRVQQALDPVSDVVCVSFLRDLLDWCRTSVPLGTLCDPSATFLIGHSRGAKISTLAATKDPRVQALFLLDPVDVTVYAPLSVEYPSAVTALSGVAATGRSLPVAIVGSGRGGDCVPKDSNYARFYDAAAAPAWEGVVEDAGHLQFLDARGGNAMDLVCAAGKVPDAAVAELAKAMMVAWGEAMVRGDNGSINRASSDSNGRTGGGHGASDDARGRLRLGVDRDGNLVAGMAPFNALQLLYATEAAARKAIKSRQEHELQLATRAKNFEL